MPSEQIDWIPDTAAFGARLALVRWKMGWNIAEAERECGTTQNLWANWEAGSMPRQLVEVAGKIAWASKVNRNWLLTGEGSPGSPVTSLYRRSDRRKPQKWGGTVTHMGGNVGTVNVEEGSGIQSTEAA